ncbi:MAG TPA: Na+/H+ antiporter NhaA [Povalibacter sp.]|uniref:Na+/H+ antiporter NhaA n=1 Tax=Povalibacter sp. TaxID=1962978 RepID=UPI002B611490|nr:Na+/H+ antiporter NhaA [Povalibacter sp.]HMN43109.1 Na+/H+ antiporter NhaA [Povalibacter sp.]
MFTHDRLDWSVDPTRDHILGPATAEFTVVEYGSYACPHCRAANARIAALRDRFGGRMRYVFRHRPLTGSDIARQAAELVEQAGDEEQFWRAHIALMTRSGVLTQEDLQVVAADLGVDSQDRERAEAAAAAVEADIASSHASGVKFTPTFFINGRRYDGPWDESSLADAMLGSLGHRVRAAALDFAAWAPSAGVLLLLMSVLAVVISNSPWGPQFAAFWEQPWAIEVAGGALRMPALDWINHGLLSIFFLIVGLEIKREFTVGHLATLRSAAMPIAAALGGMIVPTILYSLLIPEGRWSHGWGVPMATDTAFAVALIAMMGRRVPIELRIFLTAATIVDDIGAISVVAIFYSSQINFGYLAVAAALTATLAFLNRAHVYRIAPYLLIGIALWICIHASGVHATLAGVILALFIPTRPPPHLKALMTQANVIVAAEASRGDEVLRNGPSLPALRALDAIHDRIESPADRVLRHVAPSSSYFVLPLFALANAGVVISGGVFAGHEPLMLAIFCGLVIGKPLGMTLFCLLAVGCGVARKAPEYTWRQVAGAGVLSGIGFTMSLFIAAQAFPVASDFAAAKIAVFAASIAAAIGGVAVLWNARARDSQGATASVS